MIFFDAMFIIATTSPQQNYRGSNNEPFLGKLVIVQR